MAESLYLFVTSRLSQIRPKDWQAVSQGSGVNLSTLRKIGYGETKNPRIGTVELLADYFRASEHP